MDTTSKTQQTEKPVERLNPVGSATEKGFTPQGTVASPARETVTGSQSVQSEKSRVGDGKTEQAQQVMNQVKDSVVTAYDKTSKGLSKTYDQAMEFGRANPGTMSLVVFGAGLGVGLLLANNMGSRSRTRRIVPPVMDALTRVASEIFR
jgi:hypothetical protein